MICSRRCSKIAKPFGCLKFLHFENMVKWQKWSFIGLESFPNLKGLLLYKCPKLSGGPGLNAEILEIFYMKECQELEFPIKNLFSSIKRLKMYDTCYSMRSICLDYKSMICELDLEMCKFLESFIFLEQCCLVLNSQRRFRIKSRQGSIWPYFLFLFSKHRTKIIFYYFIKTMSVWLIVFENNF